MFSNFIILVNVLIISLNIIIYIRCAELSKMSIKDYVRNITAEPILKLPLKWFDWLKFVIIIGTLSALNTTYNDKYIFIIIYISYLAMFFDFYYFIYNFANTAIHKTEADFVDRMTKDYNYYIRAGILTLVQKEKGLISEEIEKDESMDEIKEDIKKVISEDITQYIPTSALTKSDLIVRGVKAKFDVELSGAIELNEIHSKWKKFLKIASTFLALLFVYDFYSLINHILNLYVLSNNI